MREKKYIDRIYQEKFKDFEAAPREEVWKSISAKLKEDRKRNPVITPFWSRIASIAAILTLILLIGQWLLPVQSNSQLVEQDVEKSLKNDIFDTISPSAIASEEVESQNEKSVIASKPNKDRKRSLSNSSELTSANIIASEESIASENQDLVTRETANKELKTNRNLPKKSLFDELAKQENDLAVAVDDRKNFEVTTHAAPIYYGNFGKGNFLDPKFNSNNSESEITFSYGINIAYAISDKLKIRSGVSKVNMSYNTNGISYSAIIGPVALSGMDAKAVSENIDITQTAKLSNEKQAMEMSANRASANSLRPGSLNQEIGFIEVPVELEYNLINNRFELNVIGGASTLFLDQNHIYVDNGNSTATGKANNLNQISFSTNIGLGLDYNLTDKFKLNFEPMIKYQLNTFNSVSSDTQPYYLGIYSGFSFKF
ncbi:MAG: hypothetical protein WBL21_12565 [Salinimicrobium sp.]